MPLAVRSRNVRKVYDGKVEAVNGLDLEIHAGECFGLLGPNGAGKTTTIEILEGILEPTSGEVEVLGYRWKTNARVLRELLGVSLQETRLSEKLTVRETLALFASFYRQPRSVMQVMEEMALTEKADSWVGNLSGGQKQMLAIARAIVEPRRLLLVDEPSKGLAPAIIQAMIEAFQELKRETTLLVVEQNFHFARALGDAVVVMDSGRIVHRGRMAELAADEALQERLLGLSLASHQ
jgi:ABC-2 type transport system ATP-binding protein